MYRMIDILQSINSLNVAYDIFDEVNPQEVLCHLPLPLEYYKEPSRKTDWSTNLATSEQLLNKMVHSS